MKGSFNQGAPRGPQPKGPQPKTHGGRPQILNGITSPFVEAIANMGEQIGTMDDFRSLIEHYGKPCHLKYLNAIIAENIEDVRGTIELLINDEAQETLKTLRKAMIKVIMNRGITLLNLPPHLCNIMLPLSNYDRVFCTDDHLPPHLRHSNYRHLSQLSAPAQAELAREVEAVIVEGYFNQERLYINSLAADLIFVLSTGVLQEIYVHSVDRIPPQVTFVPIQFSRRDIQILEV